MWSRQRSGADPVVYLSPIGILGIAGGLSPRIEAILNIIIGWAFAVVVVGTILYIAWLFWGPLPERASLAEQDRQGWDISRNNISAIFGRSRS